ncbi:hypothetical protein FS935_08590 [Metabacillus litoralis]|uniref:SH3 domain-containing protein n=1 Tax=Metabacillus litoralis TaxID=152268 RepID=A0A5C6W113_9BACI|nr:glucosaminidase domain-containing protein [Metabacillus litoralis]TXC90955.1 hypothetical protein FS935_08590 [Metabacillus litoralis]
MIQKFFTRSIVWMLVTLLMISSFPQNMLAGEEKQPHLIKVITDTEIKSNDGVNIGKVYKDTLLFVSNIPGDKENLSFHFGEKEATIQVESTVQVETSDEILKRYELGLSYSESVGMLLSHQKTIPFMDNTNINRGLIQPGAEIFVQKLDDSYIYILLGGIDYIVDRTEYESYFVQLESNLKDENSSVVDLKEENSHTDETQVVEVTEDSDAIEDDKLENSDTLEESEEDIQEKEIKETLVEDTEVENQSSQLQLMTAPENEIFTKNTKYFRVTDEQVPIYDNRSSSLKLVGFLSKGQVFPRTRDYTSWHQISYGDYYAYVPKNGTVPSEKLIQNVYSTSLLVTNTRMITTLTDTPVYDNSTGKLIQYATLVKGLQHTIIKEYTSWYSVLVSGRVGYIRKSQAVSSFLSTDSFFKVVEEKGKTPVYSDLADNSKIIGYLYNGQEYPRLEQHSGWHGIKFGNVIGYVHSSVTTPANGKSIKNLSDDSATNISITPRWDSVVYDNTKPGPLVPFAVVRDNKSYKILKEYTSWYAIEVAGRLGYIRKKNAIREFTDSDKFFKVEKDSIPVYDNRSGTLVMVGSLVKDQVYERTANYTSWHQIQFGDFKAYVQKEGTTPSSDSGIKNLNTKYQNTKKTFTALKDLEVKDNSTSPLTTFGFIKEGQSYPVISEGDKWWGILFAGRVGYVKRDYALGGIYKEVSYTDYNYSLETMINKQMMVSPQTDKYKVQYAYVAGYLISAVEEKDTYPKLATVKGTSGVNLRSAPNANSTTWVYNNVPFGKTLTIVDYAGNGWYKVEYPRHIFGGFSNAYESDVREYVDPNNFDINTKSMYQFVLLSKFAGANPTELNNLLDGKGILEGMGDAFSKGSKLAGINEIYLVSHALLETGNGKSTLATGVNYNAPDGKTYKVYNMFGINATDGNATANASKFAYEEEWFTPEAAIIGGAKFVANRYVYNGYGQDTIYEMRWNPAKPATHQYATDVGWAEKQTSNFMNMYNKLTSYQLYLDIPKYQ